MKNKLIPIMACPDTEGEYQPTLVPHGYQFRSLVPAPGAGYWTNGDHQGFDLVPELDGMVRNQTGPVIRLDDNQLFMLQDPDPDVVSFDRLTQQ
jgi:hypothetical protein